MTRGFELVTRGFELEHLVSTRGSKLLIRISQLVWYQTSFKKDNLPYYSNKKEHVAVTFIHLSDNRLLMFGACFYPILLNVLKINFSKNKLQNWE